MYPTHIVYVSESHGCYDVEDITLITIPLNLGRHATAERCLLEAWNIFYSGALDNGQESQEFTFTFVDEMIAEVVLKTNYPGVDPDEKFTLRLEV